jgi:nucleotide-binding universal stress UspA family protein
MEPAALTIHSTSSNTMNTCPPSDHPPPPFTTIGVLAPPSGSLEAILAEAGSLATLCKARLLVIHTGRKPLKLKAVLDEIRTRSEGRLQEITAIEAEEISAGGLLACCKEHAIDLLVLETARREGLLRYYSGSVVRTLSRNAQCSLLLLPEPKIAAAPPRKIVIRGISNPKTPFTIHTAISYAHHIGADEVTIVTELDQPGLSMATAFTGSADSTALLKKQIASGEIKKIHNLIDHCHSGTIKIIEEIISGRQGYAIRQFARNCNADLLVINSPDIRYGLIDRVFTHDMEYILEDLPCNLLIVHSTLP